MFHWVNTHKEKASRKICEYVGDWVSPGSLPLGKHPRNLLNRRVQDVRLSIEHELGIAEKVSFGCIYEYDACKYLGATKEFRILCDNAPNNRQESRNFQINEIHMRHWDERGGSDELSLGSHHFGESNHNSHILINTTLHGACCGNHE